MKHRKREDNHLITIHLPYKRVEMNHMCIADSGLLHLSIATLTLHVLEVPANLLETCVLSPEIH